MDNPKRSREFLKALQTMMTAVIVIWAWPGAAGEKPSIKPFGPNWIVAENQPCQLWHRNPKPGETVTWSGGCVDGKASGDGKAVWRNSRGGDIYQDGMQVGKPQGYGIFTTGDGDRYEGSWRDGKLHGRGTSASHRVLSSSYKCPEGRNVTATVNSRPDETAWHVTLPICQRRSKSTPLAGVKMHHLMRFSPALAVVPVVHRRDPRCFV